MNEPITAAFLEALVRTAIAGALPDSDPRHDGTEPTHIPTPLRAAIADLAEMFETRELRAV